MATVVNDRDLQLEATTPRLAGVALPSNVTVPGLAGAIASSKNVSLAATSQIFQIPKSGSISPANITLTATINNLVNTPTLTIQAGAMSVTPALSSGTFTFTPAQMTSDTVTLILSLTEASITYTDTMTFVKVREGIDSINVILTNENVTLPSDSSGNVLSYATAAGNIKVYQGINDVTSVCTFALASGGNPGGLTYTLPAGPGGSGGTYAVTGGFSTGAALTSLTIAVTFGSTVVNPVFTLSKAYAGAPGSVGVRGSVQLSVGLSGSAATWSDTVAASAVNSYTGVAPIRLDTVTEYNNSVSFSQTKFYDGAAWQVVSVNINGNLLVNGTVGANAFVANAITADKIDTRNLTIKDTSGNVLFGVGTIIGNDAATSLGFNPTFASWSGTYPTNWNAWTGVTPVKNTSTVMNGAPYSVQWTNNGSDSGMQFQYTFPSPLPAGTFVTGSFSMNMVNNAGGGKPGYLVRLFTNSALTTYVDSPIGITDQTVTGWQKMPWTAQAGGAAIYAIQIYQMPSWNGLPGGTSAAGTVVLYGPFTFDISTAIPNTAVNAASNWLNGNISINSNGTLSGAGTGAVSIGGLGYSGALNATYGATFGTNISGQINSGNVSTYIAAAAIGYAQITYINANQVNTVNLSAITATIGTLRTATTGQRVEITDNLITVYDSSNTVRVKIGNLA